MSFFFFFGLHTPASCVRVPGCCPELYERQWQKGEQGILLLLSAEYLWIGEDNASLDLGLLRQDAKRMSLNNLLAP